MRDIETLKLVAFVLGSEQRKKIFEKLSEHVAMSPTAIANECSIVRGNVSTLLKQMVEKELVVCLNPEANKARIYCLTEIGEKVHNHLEDVLM